MNLEVTMVQRNLDQRRGWLARISGRSVRAATTIAGVCVAGSMPLFASDWYVDAVNGNDANAGTTPATAWRTITHAHATAPIGGVETIHIAPGTYDTALGEVFPIVVHGVQSTRQFIGDAGSASTIVDVGGGNSAFRFLSDGQWIAPSSLLQGLTVKNGQTGVGLGLVSRAFTMTVRDLDISACTSGLAITAGSSNYALNVTVEHVRVHDCNDGISMSNSWPTVASVTVLESRSDHNATTGISIGRSTNATLRRVRADHNGAQGVVTDDGGFANITCTFEDSAFTQNGTQGLDFTRGLPWFGTIATVARCTVAGNLGIGVSAGGSYNSASLVACVLYGNADDVLPNASTTAAYCDIGDGDFAGSNGNFAADPLFYAPASDDYRLKWASPCIDTGDPTTPAGTLDLAGYARPIDGNLDTVELADIGALEFAPLQIVSTGKLGTTLKFELWGPQGNATTVYFTRKPLVAPQATPFGELELNSTLMTPYKFTTVGSGPPKTISRPIPLNPALLGKTYSFQALTTSAAAPQGKAYTNAVQITFVQ
jgi:hypothetical protein